MMTSSTIERQPEVAGITSGAKPPLWAKAIRTATWTALGLVAAVGLTEGLFTVAHIGEEEFVAVEPVVGFWHLPNRLVTWRSEGYSQSTTNSEGARDHAFPLEKPAGVKRIAVTGDSMVEGYQVANDQTFPKRLAAELPKDGIKTEGMNFGMSGYSTVQALYLFKEKIAKYHPDVMILSYHAGDNEKNVYTPSPGNFMPRPHALLTDGKLQTDWRGYDMWWNGPQHKQYTSGDWMRSNSRICGALTKLDLQLSDIKWYANAKKFVFKTPQNKETGPGRFTSTARDFNLPDTTFDTSFVPSSDAHWLSLPMDPTMSKAQAKDVEGIRAISAGWRSTLYGGNDRFKVTGALIDTLNRACKDINCKLVVVALPAPSNALLFKRELSMMDKLANQSGFEFVNANAEFPQIAPMQANDYYYAAHFTPRGHEAITDILHQHLKADGIEDSLRAN